MHLYPRVKSNLSATELTISETSCTYKEV